MRGFLIGMARVVASLALAGAVAWLTGALRFHPPFGAATVVAQIAAVSLGAAAVLGVWRRRWRPALASFLVVMIGAALWWSQIKPDPDHAFSPELARVVTYTVEGDTLRVGDIRNFEWRSETDFDARWETRTYRLSEVEGVDVYANYWMGPAIAHVFVSFGFKGGERLAFSIEVRYGPSDTFSLVTGFFKVNQLLYVAADERDLLTLRRLRKDESRLFRTRISADASRRLLLAYLEAGARLATLPQFYNTVTTNCTTEIFHLARAVAPSARWDWRILASGYFPNLLYDHGALNTDYSLEELYRLGLIQLGEPPFAQGAAFSAALRRTPPGPYAPRP
jgi:hypothetical protein